MNGIKNVMLISHKPAHTPPGSEHKADYSTVQMFSSITSRIPSEIRVFEIAAHNHLMAESSNGMWFVSGGGGRKLYSYTIDPEWSFISNNDHGYLQIKINNTDGKVFSTNFYGLNGRPLFNEPSVVEISSGDIFQFMGGISNVGYEKCKTSDQMSDIRVLLKVMLETTLDKFISIPQGELLVGDQSGILILLTFFLIPIFQWYPIPN